MFAYSLLCDDLSDICPNIHSSRLNAVLEVASGLQRSQSLSQASMGRLISGNAKIKNKIKKVDRLEGNTHLHNELALFYSGLSTYIFKYLSIEKHMPLVVDLCFIQDGHDIQMLSAEVALKGRTLPVYREVFGKGGLKGRAEKFLQRVHECIPPSHDVVVIMDAAFGEEWLNAIEELNWNWLLRIRGRRSIRLDQKSDWYEANQLMPSISGKAKCHNASYLNKARPITCRMITKGPATTSKRKKPIKPPRNYNAANGNYSRIAKEPIILATNLPESYKASDILKFYKKRMQIEESFRDVKSTRYGLGAREAKTTCVHRWGVKMLLAAIVQIVAWVIGIIGHSQNYQSKFQANTVRNRKVFSYFFLGQLIIQHDMVSALNFNSGQLADIIDKELAREW